MARLCVYAGCPEPATNVGAMPPSAAVNCVLVGGYCDKHMKDVLRMGGTFASGDVAEELVPVSGVKRLDP